MLITFRRFVLVVGGQGDSTPEKLPWPSLIVLTQLPNVAVPRRRTIGPLVGPCVASTASNPPKPRPRGRCHSGPAPGVLADGLVAAVQDQHDVPSIVNEPLRIASFALRNGRSPGVDLIRLLPPAGPCNQLEFPPLDIGLRLCQVAGEHADQPFLGGSQTYFQAPSLVSQFAVG